MHGGYIQRVELEGADTSHVDLRRGYTDMVTCGCPLGIHLCHTVAIQNQEGCGCCGPPTYFSLSWDGAHRLNQLGREELAELLAPVGARVFVPGERHVAVPVGHPVGRIGAPRDNRVPVRGVGPAADVDWLAHRGPVDGPDVGYGGSVPVEERARVAVEVDLDGLPVERAADLASGRVDPAELVVHVGEGVPPVLGADYGPDLGDGPDGLPNAVLAVLRDESNRADAALDGAVVQLGGVLRLNAVGVHARGEDDLLLGPGLRDTLLNRPRFGVIRRHADHRARVVRVSGHAVHVVRVAAVVLDYRPARAAPRLHHKALVGHRFDAGAYLG